MSIKVLHITYSPGGVTTYLKNLSSLSPDDIEHFIVSPDEHQNSIYKIKKRQFSFFDLIEIVRILKITAKIRPDIIHLHSSKSGLYFRPLSLFFETKYSSHAFAFLDKGSKAHKIYHFAEKTLCRVFSKVTYVANSKGDYLRAQELGFTKNTILPNPCITKTPSQKKTSQRSENQKKGILIVGRLTRQKNQISIAEFLIKNNELLKDYIFTFVGLGKIGNKKSEQQFLKMVGKIPNVDTIPWINQEQLFKLYEKSHAIITYSKFESFGYVNVEAMSCGLPVISSNVDGPPDYITNGVNGYIIHELIDLVEILRSWNVDKDSYKKVCQNAKETAATLANKDRSKEFIKNTYTISR